MNRVTLSRAKNLMRRALADLVDPPPSVAEQELLRRHFDDACAYCGGDARPRDGHIDHAVPGSGNSLGHLILACKTCNGDEKREAGWEDFLQRKCGADGTLFEIRRAKIRAWFEANPVVRREPSPQVRAALADAEAAIRGFEEAFNVLRSAVRDHG
jgi:hypothetical protein